MKTTPRKSWPANLLNVSNPTFDNLWLSGVITLKWPYINLIVEHRTLFQDYTTSIFAKYPVEENHHSSGHILKDSDSTKT